MTSRISIVIPCYNHNCELARALKSVERLNSRPAAVVVVDDGSTKPVDISTFKQTLPISLIRTSNQGLAAARNTGLAQVHTEWVIFLDADDELLPNALDDDLTFNPSPTVAAVQRGYFLRKNGAEKEVLPAVGDPVQALLQCNLGPPLCFLISTKALKTIGGFNQADVYRQGHEDYEMFTRLISEGRTLISHHQCVAVYIKSDTSMSANREKMLFTQLIVWESFFEKLEIATKHRFEQALYFFSQHYFSFLSHPKCDEKKMFHKLLVWCKEFGNRANIGFLSEKLPETLREELKEQVPFSNDHEGVVQDVFDWRAQRYDLQIAMCRLADCIYWANKNGRTTLLIWGINAIAEKVLPIVSDYLNIILIDEAKAGGELNGYTIFSPDEIDINSATTVFISTHSYYDAIRGSLLDRALPNEAIF